MEGLTGLIIVLVVIVSYFLPTLIAVLREHHNRLPIFLLNFFLGWTFIGWVAALVWSFTSPPPQD